MYTNADRNNNTTGRRKQIYDIVMIIDASASIVVLSGTVLSALAPSTRTADPLF